MKKVLLSSAISKWRNLGMECWDIFSKLMKLINGRVKTRTPGSLNLGSKCLWTSPCWVSCHHVHTPDFPYIVCTQLGLSLCDPDTAALQGPLSMEFSRQEYWSRLLFPSPGDLPKPGIKAVPPAVSSAVQVDSLPLSHGGSSKRRLGYGLCLLSVLRLGVIAS